MAYDNSFKNSVSNKEKFVNALLTHMQANYCHYTLTSKVKVVRMGELIHINKDMTDTSIPTLQDFAKNTETILNGAHLVVYLGVKSGWSYSGIAYVGTICRTHTHSGYVLTLLLSLCQKYSKPKFFFTIKRCESSTVFPRIVSPFPHVL